MKLNKILCLEISSEITKKENDSLLTNCKNRNSRPTGVWLGRIDTLQREIISDKNPNNIELRLSERLKNKQLSANLSECVPNNYIEAKNSINYSKWEIAMQNELNSLNKHNTWEITHILKK